MELITDSTIVKKVGGLHYANNNRRPMGRIYLPPDFVGKKVSITLIKDDEEEDTKIE